jgi:hypothetical protein
MNFENHIPEEKLDMVLTTKKICVLTRTYDCFCYFRIYRKPDIFVIIGDDITYQYCIDELVEDGFRPDCNHNKITDFIQIGKCCFEICMKEPDNNDEKDTHLRGGGINP